MSALLSPHAPGWSTASGGPVGRRAHVGLVGFHLTLLRRTWRGLVVSRFLTPVLFLAAMGIGIGRLVDRSSGGVAGVPYLQYVVPGIVMASAMQWAVGSRPGRSRRSSSGTRCMPRCSPLPRGSPTCCAPTGWSSRSGSPGVQGSSSRSRRSSVECGRGGLCSASRLPSSPRWPSSRPFLVRGPHGQRRGLHDHLPPRHHPTHALLGHLFPDLAVADLVAARGVGDPAVARHRAGPSRVPGRPARPRPRRRVGDPPRRAHGIRCRGWVGAHRAFRARLEA